MLVQLANREPFGPFEYHRTNNEETYWVRSYGVPRYDDQKQFIGYRGVAQDVSLEMAARRAEAQTLAELDMSECLLRGTIDCFPTAVSVFNNEQRLVFANAHYYALLDLPLSQVPIGTKFADIIALLTDRGEMFGDDVVERQVALVRSGQVTRHQRTKPNGVRIEVVITPLPNGGFIKTYTDITSSVELKAKLDAVSRELASERAKRQASELELQRMGA